MIVSPATDIPTGTPVKAPVSVSNPTEPTTEAKPVKRAVEAPVANQPVQRETVSEEHFNALAHAHNDNVNAIISNRASIDTNTAAINRNANRIANLDKQQDTDRKAAKSGTANALAVSGLHYTKDVNSIAIGAGNYEGESAGSLGYRHTFNEGHAAATVAASEDTNGGTGVAASVSIGW